LKGGEVGISVASGGLKYNDKGVGFGGRSFLVWKVPLENESAPPVLVVPVKHRQSQ
jgi:hypothetical protein